MHYLTKFKHIFQSTALKSVYRWSESVHNSLVILCLLNVLTSLTSLGLTVTTKYLIDGAISSEPDALRKYGTILVMLVLAEAVIYLASSLIYTRASAKLQHSMQGMLIRELVVKDYSGIKGYHSGELVNRLFSDVAIVKNGIMDILPDLVSTAVSFLGAVVILTMMDWRFVILLVAGGILGAALILLFKQPMKKRHKRMQEAEGALHASAQEILANLRLIKASVSEERAVEQMDLRQKGLEREQIRRGDFSTGMNNGISLVFDISWLFCMIWGCISISSGRLTYGSLAAIIQLIGRIQGPIADIVGIAGQTYGLVSSAERIQELTGLPREEEGTILHDFDEIRIEDISFQYDDGVEDVLQDVNCTIRKGDFAALTGISGGGKSSLFQLLLGIYQPTSGRVLFVRGEQEIPACRGTRELFAYVPQGNTLLSGSLMDNLTMFAKKASEQEIDAACKAACIDDLVREIGYDAVLGERGEGISEGQAQRICIARALLSGSPILLFDEATSALDEDTEARLLYNISAMRDKTCIIVTHRMAALDICDYRLHLEGRHLYKK